MRFRTLASMISTANDYSLLKWPSLINSVLITLLAFMLLLSYQSDSWFSYESFRIDKTTATTNSTIKYPTSFSYSNFGLWSLCTAQLNDLTMKCSTWIKQFRPQYFDVITILVTCAVFLANLAIFPSWALTILILYNVKNRYIKYIVAFLWIVFCFSLLITLLILASMILVGLTKYYSPGKFITDTQYISFHVGTGMYYMLIATILTIICLILLIISLIWKKFIEIKLIEDEKELYRQLNEDNYTPNWNKIIRIPRTNDDDDDDDSSEPPPYNY